VFSAFARHLFADMPKPAAATAALNVHPGRIDPRRTEAFAAFEPIYEYTVQSKSAARNWAAF
jgi:hypothetical protein